jgi:hypothetical protein
VARIGLVAACLSLAAMSPAAARDAGPPIVVELFQSQGCSSCPPADANVNAIADRSDLLVLSYGVTYWDDGGWKDTFANPQYTQRQRAYARAMHHDYIATPQVVINGRRDVEGVDRRELDSTIRGAGRPAAAVLSLDVHAVSIAAGDAPAGGADVWLVRYDPRTLYVAIRRGENGGKTLAHRNVVRDLARLGRWTGAASVYPLPGGSDPGLKTAILVQVPDGGPILAAAKLYPARTRPQAPQVAFQDGPVISAAEF